MNLSKNTRKRIYRTVLANCHMKNGVMVPFESSKLSTIWSFFAVSDKRYPGQLMGCFETIEFGKTSRFMQLSKISCRRNNYSTRIVLSKSANRLLNDGLN